MSPLLKSLEWLPATFTASEPHLCHLAPHLLNFCYQCLVSAKLVSAPAPWRWLCSGHNCHFCFFWLTPPHLSPPVVPPQRDLPDVIRVVLWMNLWARSRRFLPTPVVTWSTLFGSPVLNTHIRDEIFLCFVRIQYSSFLFVCF